MKAMSTGGCAEPYTTALCLGPALRATSFPSTVPRPSRHHSPGLDGEKMWAVEEEEEEVEEEKEEEKEEQASDERDEGVGEESLGGWSRTPCAAHCLLPMFREK
ncbi:unnamed protein product [Merluccius merluccius]